jgi:hypothetical protein
MLNQLAMYNFILKTSGSELTGFPIIISKMESSDQAEILMEALGPNLRKLSDQCPG